MEKAIQIFNEIFEVNLNEEDLKKDVEDVLDWDSFIIMKFISDMAMKYNVTIDIQQLSFLQSVQDVLDLIGESVG